ncbi:NAD-dependent epimerase/dehydratase family protein [Ascidiimonas sp. W6]|uniref:NAD-dependent epimerase/dehydratase family protein n=1 Tax=Ascidiimonas meishanensis TaxID=3128903 RepID=UPI0030EEC81C
MILVTGGTGLVGSHLLYKLIASGDKVRAIHRKGSMLEKVQEVFGFFTDEPSALFDQIEWVEADITNIPQLEKAFEGITRVYHSAALISFDSADSEAMRKINIEGTANVVNLCILKHVEKLCFVSSIASLGNAQSNGFITEESNWNAEGDNNDYAISKYGAEMEVWRGTREGVPAVIINPGVILGAGFPHQGSGKLFSMAHKGMLFYTEGKTGFVDVEDVANIMQMLMESDLKNEIYILIAKNVSFKEMMTTIAKSMGKKPPQKKAEKWILELMWRLDWILNKIVGRKRVITKTSVKAALKNSVYANDKITKALSYQFKPLDETIKNVVNRFNF